MDVGREMGLAAKKGQAGMKRPLKRPQPQPQPAEIPQPLPRERENPSGTYPG